MALTSSIARIISQGGDQLVTEHHVDAAGQTHVWTYVSPVSGDTSSLLIDHAAYLLDQLAEQELEDLIQ